MGGLTITSKVQECCGGGNLLQSWVNLTIVQEFESVCQRRKLSVNKIMKIGNNAEKNGVNISLNDKRIEEVEMYRYLGVDILSAGGMGEELNHRITEAKKAMGGGGGGALKDVWQKMLFLK